MIGDNNNTSPLLYYIYQYEGGARLGLRKMYTGTLDRRLTGFFIRSNTTLKLTGKGYSINPIGYIVALPAFYLRQVSIRSWCSPGTPFHLISSD